MCILENDQTKARKTASEVSGLPEDFYSNEGGFSKSTTEPETPKITKSPSKNRPLTEVG